MTAVNGELRCSFCNTPSAEAKKIIVGTGSVCICDQCVELCVGILKPDAEGK
ncbi:ClpX C4-type zinc finger protein [Pectobacterium aroidearum]|nr:ClpX C4-type zinc finger protein [Pectobacterium aroidearum]